MSRPFTITAVVVEAHHAYPDLGPHVSLEVEDHGHNRTQVMMDLATTEATIRKLQRALERLRRKEFDR